MDRLFLTILNMSLTGAIVIAAICLIRMPLKRVPKIISYCLWIVAGVRLAIPISFESIFGLIPARTRTIIADTGLLRTENGHIAADGYINNANVLPIVTDSYINNSNALPIVTENADALPILTDGYINNVSTLPGVTESSVISEIYTAAATSAMPWMMLITYIWLFGVVVMLAYGIVSYLILKRKMRDCTCIESNIYESEDIKSPFVLGFIHPKIFMPTGLSEDEYEYVLLHEQTHIRRWDHVIKFTAYFILSLHWFNPLAWIAFLLMSADMEMSCDERVLKEMGTKADYSRTLVSFASKRRFVGTSPLAFGEGGMKERVKNVLSFKKRSRIAVASAVVLVIAVSVGLLMNRAEIVPDYAGNYESGSLEGQPESDVSDDVRALLWANPEMQVNYEDNVDIVVGSLTDLYVPTYEQADFVSLEDDIYTLLRGMGMPRGWNLWWINRGGTSQLTGRNHPNILWIDYFARDESWSDREEIILMEIAHLLFDKFDELREVNFRVEGFEFEANDGIIKTAILTATRDAINGTEQWCLEERQSQSVYLSPLWRTVDASGRLLIHWRPVGYDYYALRDISESMPLPDSGWQFEGMELSSNRYIGYGANIFYLYINYTVRPQRGQNRASWWLTGTAEEVLFENAAKMFEESDELMTVAFRIWVLNGNEITLNTPNTPLNTHLIIINREEIG